MDDNSGCSGGLFILIIIVIVALVTKPSESDILEQFDEKCPEYLADYLNQSPSKEDFLGDLASDLFSSMDCEMLKPLLKTDDYYIFRTLEFINENGSQVIGIGIFSKLFMLPNSDKLAKVAKGLTEALLEEYDEFVEVEEIEDSEYTDTGGDPIFSDDEFEMTQQGGLAGEHSLTIQWISWDIPGQVTFNHIGGNKYKIDGIQKEKATDECPNRRNFT